MDLILNDANSSLNFRNEIDNNKNAVTLHSEKVNFHCTKYLASFILSVL